MPDLSGNLPSFIFYGSIMSEFLRIARCTRLVEDFIPRAKMLCERMVSQGGSKNLVLKQIRKAISRHPLPFTKFSLSPSEIIIRLSWFVFSSFYLFTLFTFWDNGFHEMAYLIVCVYIMYTHIYLYVYIYIYISVSWSSFSPKSTVVGVIYEASTLTHGQHRVADTVSKNDWLYIQ